MMEASSDGNVIHVLHDFTRDRNTSSLFIIMMKRLGRPDVESEIYTHRTWKGLKLSKGNVCKF